MAEMKPAAFFATFLLFAAMLFAGAPLHAQAAASVLNPSGLPASGDTGAAEAGKVQIDKAEVKKLIGTLQNAEERQNFIANLKALVAAAETAEEKAVSKTGDTAGERALENVRRAMGAIGRNFSLLGKSVANIPDAASWLEGQFSDPARRRLWVKMFLQLGSALAAALAGYLLTRTLLLGPRKKLGELHAGSFLSNALVFCGYHLLLLAPVLVFLLAGFFVMQLYELPPGIARGSMAFFNAFVVMQFCRWLLRMVFAPQAPERRILPLENESAAYLYVWMLRLTAMIVFGAFLSQAASLWGAPGEAVHAFTSLVGLLVTLMVIVIVMQNRAAVAAWIRGKPSRDQDAAGESRSSQFLQGLRTNFASVWHVLAIIYLVVGYFIATLDAGHGFATLTRATVATVLVLVVFYFLLRGVDHLVSRGFALPEEMRRQLPRLEERTNAYLPLFRRVFEVLVWGVGILVLLSVWGFDTFDWFTERPGKDLISAGAGVLVTLVLAAMAWEIINSLVERFLSGVDARGRPVERSARMRTLMPLLRYALQILVVVVAGIAILSTLGVDITPLLAGAGIIGLAIGFGAQALVKDVITGLFILIEDTVSVGDIVTVGDHGGVVEGITIRTLRLRDLGGHVHTIPFGEISSMVNMTKEYAQVVIDLGVDYETDLRRTMSIMKEVGDGMCADPQFKDMIFDPLEMWGVDKFDDYAVVIRARMKTRPFNQWTVKREYNLRLKEALDKAGIGIPYPISLNYPPVMLNAVQELAFTKLAPVKLEDPKAKKASAPKSKTKDEGPPREDRQAVQAEEMKKGAENAGKKSSGD